MSPPADPKDLERKVAVAIQRLDGRRCLGCGIPYPPDADDFWCCPACLSRAGSKLGRLAARWLSSAIAPPRPEPTDEPTDEPEESDDY